MSQLGWKSQYSPFMLRLLLVLILSTSIFFTPLQSNLLQDPLVEIKAKEVVIYPRLSGMSGLENRIELQIQVNNYLQTNIFWSTTTNPVVLEATVNDPTETLVVLTNPMSQSGVFEPGITELIYNFAVVYTTPRFGGGPPPGLYYFIFDYCLTRIGLNICLNPLNLDPIVMNYDGNEIALDGYDYQERPVAMNYFTIHLGMIIGTVIIIVFDIRRRNREREQATELYPVHE